MNSIPIALSGFPFLSIAGASGIPAMKEKNTHFSLGPQLWKGEEPSPLKNVPQGKGTAS